MSYLDNPQVFLFDRKLTDRYIKEIVIRVLRRLELLGDEIDDSVKTLLNHIADAYIVNDFAGLNEHRRNNLFGNESLSEETRLRIIRLLLKMNIDIDVVVYNEDYDIEYPIYEYVIDLIELELYEKSRRDNIINRYLLGISKNEYNEYKVELKQDTMIVTDDGDYRINKFYEQGLK